MTTLYILAASLFVMFASLSGVLFVSHHLGRWMRAHLALLATFSAGIVAVLAYHLLEEALHEAPSAAYVAIAVFLGAIVLEAIHRLVPDAHHHHEETDHTHSEVDGRRLILSDAVHNVTDGFLIVSAFLADWRIGIGATVGIFIHELVQEISEFFVLRHAGYTTRRALALNFAASSTILVGVVLALLLSSWASVLSILSGFAAGGFISVLVRDLVPSAIKTARSRGHVGRHITALVLGIAFMVAITIALPHAEHHEDEVSERHLAADLH